MRLSKIWTLTIRLFALVGSIFAAQGALAFGGTNHSANEQITSSCTALMVFQPAAQIAYIQFNPGYQMAGGNYFAFGGSYNTNSISAGSVKSTCGFDDVKNFSQNGADGAFADDSLLGFTFEARETAAAPYYRYRYEFVGQTDTQLLATKELVQDLTPPSVSLYDLSVQSSGVATAKISISELPTGFAADDISLTNATVNMTGSGQNFQVTITPIDQGNVAVSIPANAFTDAAGNANTASAELTYLHDTIRPTVTMSGWPSVLTSNAAVTINAVFSEPVTGFNIDDISANNGSVSNLTGSGTSYTFTLTPSGGDASITVRADAAFDVKGLGNPATTTAAIPYDSTSPSVTITGVPTTIVGNESFSIGIDFSENVIGFTASDIQVTGGTLSNFSGSGAAYTATIAASGQGDVSVSVPANVATDAANNGNTASTAQSASNTVVAKSQEMVADTIVARTNALIANQPNLTNFLTATGSGFLRADITRGNGFFEFGTDATRPVWMRLKGSKSTVGSAETTYGFGAIGSHWRMNDTTLVGGMVQLDFAETTDGASTTKGTGWLAGPYVVKRLESQPLYFEASVLFGQTKNDVSPLGTYTDTVTTDRWLANLRVTGEVNAGNLTLFPHVAASHAEETQHAYTDGLSNPVAEQKVSLTEAALGLDFAYPLSEALTLTGGASRIWSDSSVSGGAPGVVPAFSGGRSRVDLGLSHTAASGLRTTARAFYDGIGANNFESAGMELLLEYEF